MLTHGFVHGQAETRELKKLSRAFEREEDRQADNQTSGRLARFAGRTLPPHLIFVMSSQKPTEADDLLPDS